MIQNQATEQKNRHYETLIPFSKQRIQKIPTQFTVAFSPFMILVDSLSSTADSRPSVLQSVTHTIHFQEPFHL